MYGGRGGGVGGTGGRMYGDWGMGVGGYARGSFEKIARHEDPVSMSTVNACVVRSPN